jgi:hypothetical protein
MARAFEAEVRAALAGEQRAVVGPRPGFFAWVEGAPAEGYRAPRTAGTGDVPVTIGRRPDAPTATVSPAPVVIVTGAYGAEVLAPLVDDLGTAARSEVRVLPVDNCFFGGNIAVTGLLTGVDVARALRSVASHARVLLPDVMLSNGRFLDGTTLDELPREVEVVATDGASLVAAVTAPRATAPAPS